MANLFEDIGRSQAVGNLAQQTLQNVVQVGETKRRQAIDEETLSRERQRFDVEMRRVQAQEQAASEQAKLRATRVPLETHPFYQSLPVETQQAFKGQLSFVDPADPNTGTYSLGGIQDTMKMMESDAQAFKSVMGPVVAKAQNDMVAAQQEMARLEQAGKTDSKEYAAARENFQAAQQKYMVSNDGYAKHLMTLDEIDARAKAAALEANKSKDPVKVFQQKVNLLKDELDSLIKTHRTTQEEEGLINALLLADPADPQAFANAMATVNAQKTVYDGLPPQIKDRVDEILGQMKGMNVQVSGQPGVRSGDIDAVRKRLRGE